MADRLVAVNDADYRLPPPVRQGIAADAADTSSELGRVMEDNWGRAISVKSYGAKGDGTTDDTAAILAAEAAAHAIGASLWFPSGVYLADRFQTRVSLRGDRSSIRLRTPAFTLLEIVASNVTIENLILDGNDLSTGYIIDHATNSAGVRIIGCELKNASGTGTVALIRVRAGCDRMVIEDNWLHGAKSTTIGRGILIGSNDGTGTVVGVKIRGNTIEDIEPAIDGDGIVVQNFTATVDVSITNNLFQRCRKRGVKVQCAGVLVEGNRIHTAYDAAMAQQAYSAISVYAANCRVQNNTLIGVWATAAIDLGAVSVPISDVDVCDNVILGDIPNRRPSGDGISFDSLTPSITRCHISRNTVVGVRHGVRLQNVIDQTEAIGNHFTSLTGSAYVVDDNNVGTAARVRVGGGSIKSVANYSVTTDGGAAPAVLVIDPIIGSGGFGALTTSAASGSRAALHGVDPAPRALAAPAATDATTTQTLVNDLRASLIAAGILRAS